MKLLRQATYIPDMCQRTIKIYPNQHTEFHRFLSTEDSLKIKKGLELVPRSHFS